jgi:hypothetical protein
VNEQRQRQIRFFFFSGLEKDPAIEGTLPTHLLKHLFFSLLLLEFKNKQQRTNLAALRVVVRHASGDCSDITATVWGGGGIKEEKGAVEHMRKVDRRRENAVSVHQRRRTSLPSPVPLSFGCLKDGDWKSQHGGAPRFQLHTPEMVLRRMALSHFAYISQLGRVARRRCFAVPVVVSLLLLLSLFWWQEERSGISTTTKQDSDTEILRKRKQENKKETHTTNALTPHSKQKKKKIAEYDKTSRPQRYGGEGLTE